MTTTDEVLKPSVVDKPLFTPFRESRSRPTYRTQTMMATAMAMATMMMRVSVQVGPRSFILLIGLELEKINFTAPPTDKPASFV